MSREQEKLKRLDESLKKLEEQIDANEEEYHSSDLVRKQKSLQEQIDACTKEIAHLVVGLQEAKRQLKTYGSSWLGQIQRLEQIHYPVDERISGSVPGSRRKNCSD